MIESIVMLLFVILLFYVAFKVINGIIKAMIAAVVVLIVIFAVAGLFVYQDAKSLQQDMLAGGKLLALDNNGTVLVMASVVDDPNGKLTFNKVSGNITELMGNYSRTFIFEPGFFLEMGESLVYEDISISPEDLQAILVSNQPVEDYLVTLDSQEKELARKAVESRFKTQDDFRAAVFIFSVIQASESGGIEYFFEQYKEGNLKVYPKTMLFRAVDILPRWMMSLYFIMAG
jgi:hypothetical protein